MTRTSCRAPAANSTSGGLIARSRVGSSVSSPFCWVQRNSRTCARTGVSGSVLLSHTAAPFSPARSSTEVGATCRLAASVGPHRPSRAIRTSDCQVFGWKRGMASMGSGWSSIRDGGGDGVAVTAGARVAHRQLAVDLDVLLGARVAVAVHASGGGVAPLDAGGVIAGTGAGVAAVELVGNGLAAGVGHPAIVDAGPMQAPVQADLIGDRDVAADPQRAESLQLLSGDHGLEIGRASCRERVCQYV